MRVYRPATRDDLVAVRDGRDLAGGPAYAATDEVRSALPGADDEECELVASLAAAQASPDGLVVAADLDGVRAGPSGGHPAAVVVAAVPRRRVRALLVAGGDEELSWYAPQEVDLLLGG